MFGLPQQTAMALLNDMGEKVRAGQRFTDGQQVDDLVRDLSVLLVEVPQSYGLTNMANALYGADRPVQVLQVVWPDTHARWPWDAGYDIDVRTQPVPGKGIGLPKDGCW